MEGEVGRGGGVKCEGGSVVEHKQTEELIRKEVL